jgi:hypothetical protein
MIAEEKEATAIFVVSLIPKISMNKGKNAVAGIDRKKSITNSVCLYRCFDIPNSRPIGHPMIAAIKNDRPTRISVDLMSVEITPSESNLIVLLSVSIGHGKRN